ncbi:MAG: hypothetical protein JF588_02560 [Caulobacterales bacterium]|nr:hypothetical protein [Caulobacterales bacterium]
MANLTFCRERALQLLIQSRLSRDPEVSTRLLLRAAHWQELALHLSWLRARTYPGGLPSAAVIALGAAGGVWA